MKNLCIICLFTCVQTSVWAQVNFVKNPSFEEYSKCPDNSDQLIYANFWRGIIDSNFSGNAEYYNACSNTLPDHGQHVPDNTTFYQYPHSGNGMVGGHLYYDKTPPNPPSPLPFDYRDNIQGHLIAPLENGKTYCVTFWVNLIEASGYAHNKIGAYLDNGSINAIPLAAGSEITTVSPQIYTNTVISDTANWTKIEGSFVATGNETHISISNFFTNAATTKIVASSLGHTQYSYYLIDDVSVIPIDLSADAGLDTWVELGKQVKIGRTKDSATAMGLDCKWYHKGALIDSGAIITVNANALKHAIDTYVVVQTICGIVKRDTVTVFTAGLGLNEMNFDNQFVIFPNPSNGNITISSSIEQVKAIYAKIYDLLGREILHQKLSFSNKQATLKLEIPNGTYIIELKDEAGNVQRERIVIE